MSTYVSSTINSFNSNLSSCIYGGNGSVVNGAIITTRSYNNSGYTNNNYCVNVSTIMNISNGEMFYEVITAPDVMVIGYDQTDGDGNQVDLIPNIVKSVSVQIGSGGQSNNGFSGRFIILIIICIIMIMVLSYGGYHTYKHYRKGHSNVNPSADTSEIGIESPGTNEGPMSREGPEGLGGGYYKIRY
jgi:hypothetical protein